MGNFYMYDGMFYPGMSPFDPYGVMLPVDSTATDEERSQNAFSGLICVLICYIGFPLAIALGYGLCKLITGS
jgi:hypothetical protein